MERTRAWPTPTPEVPGLSPALPSPTTLGSAAAAQSNYVTLGLAPLAGPVNRCSIASPPSLAEACLASLSNAFDIALA